MVGAIAFAVAALSLPLVIRFCARWRFYDSPGPLKIHSHQVSRLGGISIGLAILAGAVIVAPTSGYALWPFLAALILVWLAGLIDDFRGLSPAFRIAAQIAAAILLWHGGWRIPFEGAPGLVGQCILVVLFVSAFNFLDGTDGLAAGIAAIIALGYEILPGFAANHVDSALAWAVAGSCLGFLLFNFPPAKIFMGDSGSNVLGFATIFLDLCFYRSLGIRFDTGSADGADFTRTAAAALIFPLFIAALPLLDAVLAVLRRLLNRRSPFCGDRRHFYDLLMVRGWSNRKVALACYAVTGTLVIVARSEIKDDTGYPIALFALVLVILLFVAIPLGSLRMKDRVGRWSAAPHAPKALPRQESGLG